MIITQDVKGSTPQGVPGWRSAGLLRTLFILVTLKILWSFGVSLLIEASLEASLHTTLIVSTEVVGTLLFAVALYMWIMRPFLALTDKTHQALLNSEVKYRETFDKAAIGVGHVGLDGSWIRVNEQLSRLVGYTPEELYTMRFQDISYQDDLPEDLENVAKLAAGEIASYDMEKRYICKDGSIIWINLTASLVKKPCGEPDFFIAVVEDITARKKTEKRLALLGRILEVSLNELYIFDADSFKFLTVNFGARQNLDYSIEELRNMTPLDIKPEYSQAAFTELVSPLKDGKQEKTIFNTVHRRKDGSTYPVEVHLQYAAKETPPVFVAFILDTTERDRLTKDLNNTVNKLKRASTAKSEFLANMSHELRTPLNAIIGFSEVISNQYLGEIEQEKYVEYAHDIENSGKYLLELINDILDLSKIEAGRYTLNRSHLDMGAIINTSISLLRQRAVDKGVVLEAIEKDEQLHLWADARSVKQILLNIMGNALKFTPSGGKITVTSCTKGDHAEISVLDTGPGIPENQVKKLMHPYVTAHDESDLTEDSTGLGLSITKSLVSMHGGQMEILSEEGRGTEVVIRLPIDNIENA